MEKNRYVITCTTITEQKYIVETDRVDPQTLSDIVAGRNPECLVKWIAPEVITERYDVEKEK